MCLCHGHVASFHHGFWLWIRSHSDWHDPLLQAFAAAPPAGQEAGMLQQVPVALAEHWGWSATSRLHFIVPGQGVAGEQATPAAQTPCAPIETPWKAA